MFMFSGCSAESYRALNDFLAFDLYTLTWAQVERLNDGPSNRWNHCSICHDDSIILFGGMNEEYGPVLQDMWKIRLQLKTPMDVACTFEPLEFQGKIPMVCGTVHHQGNTIIGFDWQEKSLHRCDLSSMTWSKINIDLGKQHEMFVVLISSFFFRFVLHINKLYHV